MPRDPNIPDAFDVYTVVVLRRPADAPEMPDDELDALQARHPSVAAGRLAYDVMEWWTRSGSLDFPRVDGQVGDRRAMPDD